MRVRAIESVDSWGSRCIKVQRRVLFFWYTVREFNLLGEEAAKRMAELMSNPRVLFDSEQDANGRKA